MQLLTLPTQQLHFYINELNTAGDMLMPLLLLALRTMLGRSRNNIDFLLLFKLIIIQGGSTALKIISYYCLSIGLHSHFNFSLQLHLRPLAYAFCEAYRVVAANSRRSLTDCTAQVLWHEDSAHHCTGNDGSAHDRVAEQFSMHGKKGKERFDALKLHAVIFGE